MGLFQDISAYVRRTDALVPPPWLHSIGQGDYRTVGDEFLGHFTRIGGLKPTDRVLDIGCGTGRMAAPLTTFLTTGTYDGFDIVERSIKWCQKAYAPFPNFRFHFVDLHNKRYNRGRISAEQYRFPFPDQSFDFVFLTSVFTHMQKKDVAHYLTEIARVLAPEGRAFLTAFLLDEPTRALIADGKSYHTFRHDLDGCYTDNAAVPEAAVAYDADDLFGLIRNAGLRVSHVANGEWRGEPGLSWQDVIVATQRSQ